MKWIDLIYNATFGILGEYKDASVDLVKIQITRYYLEFAKILRQQSLLCVAAIAGALLIANLLMILEVSILLYCPFRPVQKILLAVAVGLAGSGAVFVLILRLFAEEHWMRLTGSDRLVAAAVKGSSRRGMRGTDEE